MSHGGGRICVQWAEGQAYAPMGFPPADGISLPWVFPKERRPESKADLSAPSVSYNTSVPNCLRLALGVHNPIPSNIQPLPLFNKNGGQEVRV